jgi:hypothetical protein
MLPPGLLPVVVVICSAVIVVALTRITKHLAAQKGGDARLPLLAAGGGNAQPPPHQPVPVSDDDWEKVSNASRSSGSLSSAAASPRRPATAAKFSASGGGGGGGGGRGSGSSGSSGSGGSGGGDPLWSPRKPELLASFLAIIDPELARTTSALPPCDAAAAPQPPPALAWESAKQAKGVHVYTAAVAGNEFRALKAVGLIHAPPAAVCAFLMELSTLAKVDDMLEDARMVQQFEPDFDVHWMRYKAVWPTAARDFCVMVATVELEHGAHLIATRSVAHGGCAAPGDAVRAGYQFGGYLCRPANDGRWTDLTLISHIDLNGNIPAFVINQLTAGAPVKLFNKINEVICRERAAAGAGQV